MKSKTSFNSRFLGMLLCAFSFCLLARVDAQIPVSKSITIYQYRFVPADKTQEFIKRETTYWSEVAKKSMEKGNLTFWALLEKVGGNDLLNSPNFLFINTYKDIDDAGAVWSPITSLFPKIPMAQMQTDAISKVTSTLFLSEQAWEQSSKATEKDFKYVDIIYHQASSASALIGLEKKHWAPFIKAAMDKGQTTQLAWGNAVLLSPSGQTFSTVSFDLYPNLKETLYPTWDEKTVFPEDGLTEIMKVEGTAGRHSEIYRIVKSVSAPTGLASN